MVSTLPGRGVMIVAAVLAVAAVGCGEGAGSGSESTPAVDATSMPTADAPTADAETSATLTGKFTPLDDNSDRDITGEATLTRSVDGTTLSVRISGLEPNTTHPAHLHEGSCADRGPHYQHDPEGVEEPPNELWPSSDPADPTAGLQAEADGDATGEGTADWEVRDEPVSVFVHSAGGEHVKIACADLS